MLISVVVVVVVMVVEKREGGVRVTTVFPPICLPFLLTHSVNSGSIITVKGNSLSYRARLYSNVRGKGIRIWG
jgi:hypothetical protein